MWFAFFLLNLVAAVTTPILVIPFALLQRVPWWLNTPDDLDLTKQGLYEPQVAAIYAKYGQRVKTWYWLGVRNQMYGLFWRLSVEAPVGTLRIRSTPTYPTTRPFRPGFSHTTMTVSDHTFNEWTWVWEWSATKCGQIRIGWKLEEMDIPGPVAFCFQIKPFLTKG